MPEIKLETNDFIEMLLRNLVRSRPVFEKAKILKVVGDDFILDEMFGVQLYKEFIDTIMELDICPLDMQLFCAHIKRKFEDNIIPDTQYDVAAELIDSMYEGDLSPVYFVDHLKPFLKTRRSAKISHLNKNDPDLLFANMQALMVDLQSDDFSSPTVNLHPFAAPLYKSTLSLTRTGLDELDEKIMGLGYGEYGIIVGFSGGGKTVLGCNICANNAVLGFPATFMSLEADETEIAQRFYSRFYEIPYGELHKGVANLQLGEVFKAPELETRRQALAKNLHVAGLKGRTPLNADQLYQVLLRKYETEGFVPQTVVVDQLQFVEPRVVKKSSAAWEMEKLAAAELDELSHKTIGGHKFALWVLHQGKGKLKRLFTRDDIDGFKGIVHKADLVLGIGRDDTTSDEASIFSLKVRHCAMFNITFNTDFGFMKFGSRIYKDGERRARPTSNPMEALDLPDLPDELPEMAAPDEPPRPPEVVDV